MKKTILFTLILSVSTPPVFANSTPDLALALAAAMALRACADRHGSINHPSCLKLQFPGSGRRSSLIENEDDMHFSSRLQTADAEAHKIVEGAGSAASRSTVPVAQ